MLKRRIGIQFLIPILLCISIISTQAQKKPANFRVLAFYTAKNDRAHISFVHEANNWFANMSLKYNFKYDSTNNWNELNDTVLSRY